MPLEIIRNDITKIECDAIVNAANSSLLGGGGVDGAIHRAAGRELLEECKTLGGCKTGEAKSTKGYNLPAKYVIHTVGPIYKDGQHNEKELLESCYKNSLEIAKNLECESVAFPLISAGVYGYPVDEALNVAISVISQFLMQNDMLVYIVVFDKKALNSTNKLFSDIEEYIDDNYVDEQIYAYPRRNICYNSMPIDAMPSSYQEDYSLSIEEPLLYEEITDDLDDVINEVLDESFSQMLIRMIDERGMKDSECYKKANIDRKLFSKIKNNIDYKPSKQTAIAFCIALELPLDKTNEMLMKAGFALSHSSKFDVIVEYFIKNKKYDIFEINEALFYYDQNLLGV